MTKEEEKQSITIRALALGFSRAERKKISEQQAAGPDQLSCCDKFSGGEIIMINRIDCYVVVGYR